MMLGIIHDGLKEHEQAQAHYEAVLKLDPRFAPAANNLAWILVEHGGNLDVALSHAQMAREQQPNDSYIADTLGWVYYKKCVSSCQEPPQRRSGKITPRTGHPLSLRDGTA